MISMTALQPDLWERIGELARLAPSPHNTQPFRICPRGADHAELVACPERFLPAEDHGNRYVASSFGIFASCLEAAARAHGRSATVTPAADVNPAQLHRGAGRTVIGHMQLEAACEPTADAALLRVRRTSRLPYDGRTITPGVLAELHAAAASFGHRLIETHDAVRVTAMLSANADAVIDNLQIAPERNEIKRWTRFGATPESGDGLWTTPMNQPAWELRSAFAAPWLFRAPGFRQFARHRYLRTQAGTRHVALLCGRFESWPELVQAGRALAALWFSMAERGVVMQPSGSMLTNPHYAKLVADAFEVDDCWLLFRFGHSQTPPCAPRLETLVER